MPVSTNTRAKAITCGFYALACHVSISESLRANCFGDAALMQQKLLL